MGRLKGIVKIRLLNLILIKIYLILLQTVKKKLCIFLKENYLYIFLTAIFLKPFLKHYYIPDYMSPIMLPRKMFFFVLT